jgi:hypothetical protein
MTPETCGAAMLVPVSSRYLACSLLFSRQGLPGRLGETLRRRSRDRRQAPAGMIVQADRG